MKSYVRRAAAIAAMTTTIGAASVGVGGQANAFPAQCGWGYQSNGVVAAWCSQGTGSVAAVAGCKNIFNWWTTAVGPYVNIKNGASKVSCPFGYGPQWGGYYLR